MSFRHLDPFFQHTITQGQDVILIFTGMLRCELRWDNCSSKHRKTCRIMPGFFLPCVLFQYHRMKVWVKKVSPRLAWTSTPDVSRHFSHCSKEAGICGSLPVTSFGFNLFEQDWTEFICGSYQFSSCFSLYWFNDCISVVFCSTQVGEHGSPHAAVQALLLKADSGG